MSPLLATVLCILFPLGAAPTPDLDFGRLKEKDVKVEEAPRRGPGSEARRSTAAPPWMDGCWGSETRHYAALVPGDPTKVYFWVGKHWIPCAVQNPQFRLDLVRAWSLPLTQDPGLLPRPDMRSVLFD
jgi:hypothetical protein